ncbi:MAG: hypothetical protein HHJ17_17765 [Rhodoferax sp.]|uniref:hypothetical protein n=1 Tax=Rhodoferax sp. TaxID=50421 RepID=UPI00179C2C2C|nr:hypothetical protein [Rhodoferax sp.]NMM15368.1 hypothetical protein [Rhodoferax sp.]
MLEASTLDSAHLFAKAVRGCKQSADTLVHECADLNGKVEWVHLLCRRKAPRGVVRHVLLNAIAKHPRCIHPEVTGSRALLRELFEYAAYPKPKRAALTLYRGFAGAEQGNARKGYYWSSLRGTAVYYALMRCWQHDVYSPVILASEVIDRDIAAATDIDAKQHLSDVTDSEIIYECIVLREQQRATVEIVGVAEARIRTDAFEALLLTANGADGMWGPGDADAQILRAREWLENYENIAAYRNASWR